MVYRHCDMRFPKTNYHPTNCCVAYLDILGGKSLICSDKEHKFLNYLNMLCEDAFLESSFENEIFVKVFSDNMLFAIELEDNDKLTRIQKIINIVANIQNEALRYGYLIRGAIVEGELFYNNIFVYGKALVEAVKMEEEDAIYPRIITQNTIAELLPQYFLKNEDGWSVLNNFSFSHGFEHIYFKHNLLKMLKTSNKEKVKRKIMWVINYFNWWFCLPEARCLECPQITEEDIKNAINYKESLSE